MAFLRASVGGPEKRAAALLAKHPELATLNIRTALVLGDVPKVRETLAVNPDLAQQTDPFSGWPAILAVCSSRWHRIDPSRLPGMLEVAEMLLDAGADPNSSSPGRGGIGRCSTLYGAAGTANNPALTRLLLERGAIPSDHTLYLAAFFDDHQCLQLLLPRVKNIGESQALAAPISTGDVEGVRILLDAGVDPRRPVDSDLLGERRGKEAPISPVAAAIEFLCRAELIELLLRYG
ncbi:MAG: hypothetical protein ACRDGS_00330, partial [Chloroflexota bacterium]